MFGKTKDSGSSSSDANQAQQRRGSGRMAAPSIICSDMTIVGTITCTGDIQIDGKIEGDIYSTCLTVGEKAVITGEIRSDEVIIRGHVVGGIRARKVNLAATCHVEGDITHNALAVETGAFFQGNIRHADDPLNDAMAEADAAIEARQQQRAAQAAPQPQAARPAQQPQQPAPQPQAPQPAPNGAAQPQPQPQANGAFPQAAAQGMAQPPQGQQPGMAQQPSPTQQAAQAQRSRQTFAQFNPGNVNMQGVDTNDALNAALQKLSASTNTGGSVNAARPQAPRPGQPMPGPNGQFPPRNQG